MTDTAPREHTSQDATPAVARATVLVVDDTDANLQALEVILEPLDVDVITASSGREALRTLLDHDIAVIVLDVRMPGMDGFETAHYVKQRARTRHVPIIFLTAMGNDREQALSGYQAGAVDYIEKPVEPIVLRAKVSTFAELYASRMQVARQAELLRAADAREAAREIEAVRERGARQFHELAEVMPSMVFAIDADGRVTYRNPRWAEYSGGDHLVSVTADMEWTMVHPADRPASSRAWAQAFSDPDSLPGGRLEIQARLRRFDGVYLWHVISAVPRHEDGMLVGWVGSATEIDTQRRSEAGQHVLSEAGAVLVTTSAIDTALVRVAELAVPAIVDWCSIDVLEEDGMLRRVAMRVDGNISSDRVERLGSMLSIGNPKRSDAPVFGDDLPRRLLLDADGRDVGSDHDRAESILVPLMVRGEQVGMVTLAVATLGRVLGPPERSFAQALATRLASAIDSARLYRGAQRRAQAAAVLDAIADGVALIDDTGIVRLWNPAAALITGIESNEIVGRRPSELLADWDALAARVDVADAGSTEGGVTTAPLTSRNGRDLWLSVSAVGFALGVAYAFRDLTEERTVERMKSDFVATVSHELRTPLASIYGAAVTLQRDDVELEEPMRDQLLDIIGQQSQQLAGIVDAVLTASRLDAKEEPTNTTSVDARTITREVVDASRNRTQVHDMRFDAPDDVPLVEADPGHLRQVLDNLVENAIKYSPDGGEVLVSIEPRQRTLQIRVRDCGIGIPASEQRRIFDKFYRVDADMSLGVGGTGLGLFIVSELVRRMSGQIDVESAPGSGTTFTLSLPLAHGVATA